MRKGSSLTPSSLQSPTSARRCDAPAPNDGVTSEIVEPRRDRLLAVGKAGTAEHVRAHRPRPAQDRSQGRSRGDNVIHGRLEPEVGWAIDVLHPLATGERLSAT